MPKTSTAPNRRELGEKGVAQKLLEGFEPEGSRGMQFVMKIFNNQISVTRLVDLGKIFSNMLNIEFPRNYKRNRDLLIKWFDMNIDLIEPYASKITLEFDNDSDDGDDDEQEHEQEENK